MIWPFRKQGMGLGAPAAPRVYEANQVEKYIRGALSLADALGKDHELLRDEATDQDYKHIQSAQVAAGEISHSFGHGHDQHLLIVNQCSYPDMMRQLIHVHIPGKLQQKVLEEMRAELGFIGDEGIFEQTLYVHWKKPGEELPVFADIWIDNYTAMQPALTRMMIEVTRPRAPANE